MECRGLPIVAWTEENFSQILSPFGKIISYDPILDENGFFKNPKILTETKETLNINSVVNCKLMNKSCCCGIVE